MAGLWSKGARAGRAARAAERAYRPSTRYLLGIVRNLETQREGELAAEILLRLRRQAHDTILRRLELERDGLLTDAALPDELLGALVDRALLTEGPIDPAFWLEALVDFVQRAPPTERDDRYLAAAQYVHATFRADLRRRRQVVHFLAKRLIPLPRRLLPIQARARSGERRGVGACLLPIRSDSADHPLQLSTS